MEYGQTNRAAEVSSLTPDTYTEKCAILRVWVAQPRGGQLAHSLPHFSPNQINIQRHLTLRFYPILRHAAEPPRRLTTQSHFPIHLLLINGEAAFVYLRSMSLEEKGRILFGAVGKGTGREYK